MIATMKYKHPGLTGHMGTSHTQTGPKQNKSNNIKTNDHGIHVMARNNGQEMPEEDRI